MPPLPTIRPLMKKGKTLPKREKKKTGFDYPAQQVGVSNWLGSDGKPVTVYVDPATGSAGLAAAQYLLGKIDDVMNSCDFWFGVKGASGNIIIAPDFGGAYHYGCSFDQGGDWYLSLSANDTVVGLAIAEVCESYMGLQNKGWNCGGSGGEALSRVLAELATGGAAGAMADYSAGPSWDGADWISRDQGTDQDYPSIGCGVLYLWWMFQQGYSAEDIVQAGESGGTLAGNYRTLTGKATAFADFVQAAKAVGAPGNISNDNPFNAPNPPYPAGGSPTPPPPPPPPPPGSEPVNLTGTLDFFGQSLPVTMTGTVGAAAGRGRMVNTWALVAALAKLADDMLNGNTSAIGADLLAVLAALGIDPASEEGQAICRELAQHVGKP